jgi:hypothetical protein
MGELAAADTVGAEAINPAPKDTKIHPRVTQDFFHDKPRRNRHQKGINWTRL